MCRCRVSGFILPCKESNKKSTVRFFFGEEGDGAFWVCKRLGVVVFMNGHIFVWLLRRHADDVRLCCFLGWLVRLRIVLC